MARYGPPLMVLLLWPGLVGNLAAHEPFDRLQALLEQATFTAVTDEDVASSRQSLRSRCRPNRETYRPMTGSSCVPRRLRRLCQADEPDMRARLENLVQKLSLVAPPFDDPQLLELRRLSRVHLRLLADGQDDGLEALFGRVKAALRDALTRYQQSGSPRQHRRFGDRDPVAGRPWPSC